ncbi:MAG: LamG-like jellyroll fold domain-containing protein [Bacteroidia bacterium]
MRYLYLLGLVALVSFSAYAQTGGYKALNFNGSTDDVTIKDKTAINPTSELTVEAWIKPESFARNIYENSVLCKHGWSSGNAGYVLRCGASGQASFNVASSTGSWMEAQSSTGVLTTGTWYHIAGTFDGDTVSVYVNGILVGSRLYKGSITPSSGLDAKIGELANGSGRNFDGDIDEVRIWKSAVDENTLRDWMCQRVNSTHPDYKNLVGYFQMNEGTGSSTADSSSSALSAAINGADWANSGAPIGNVAINSYTSVSNLKLQGDSSDNFEINNIKGKYQSVHLYRLKGKTQVSSVNTVTATVDTLQSWGVYFSKPSGVSYNVNYDYSGFKGNETINECSVDLFYRKSLPTWAWNTTNSNIYLTADSITISNQKSGGEYILGNVSLNRVLTTNTGDSVFCSAETITISGPGNSSFSYKWYKDGKLLPNDTLSALTVNSAGKYSCEFSRGSNCVYKSNVKNISTVKSPNVSLSALSNVCIDKDTVVINGGLPGGGTYSGLSISLGDSIFKPSSLSAGVYNVVYSFTNKNNCTNTDTQSIEIFKLPNVSAKRNYQVCDNLDTVHLKGATPNGGTYTGAGINRNIFYLDSINRKTGKYTYVYEYTDLNGCSNTASSNIQVVFSTPITFNPIDTSCVNQVPFKIKTNPNQGVYEGNGMSGREFNPAKAGVGSHWISFKFENIDGCITKDSQIAVVNGVTQASFNTNTKLCENDDTLLLKSGIPKGGVYAGNGITNGVFDPQQSGEGNHTISYIFTNSSGCSDTANSSITVASVSDLSLTAVDAQCYNGSALVLNAVSPTGGNYQGKGVTGTSFTPKSAGAGVHNIEYEFTNADGCKSDTAFTIEVYEPRAIKFSIDTQLCSNGDSIDLSSTRPKNGVHTGTGVRNEYLVPALLNSGTNWLKYTQVDVNNCENFDSIEVILVQVPDVSFSIDAEFCKENKQINFENGMPAGGKYYIDNKQVTGLNPGNMRLGLFEAKYEYKVQGSDCSSAAVKSFIIKGIPEKPSIVENNNALTSSAASGNQWFDVNGAISGEKGKNFTPSANGDYYVVVTNDSLCTNQSDVFSFTNSSINNSEINSVKLYPNPTSGIVLINSDLKTEVETVTVLDLSGKTVYVNSNVNGVKKLNVSNLQSGTYLVKLITTKQDLIIQKLIINRN